MVQRKQSVQATMLLVEEGNQNLLATMLLVGEIDLAAMPARRVLDFVMMWSKWSTVTKMNLCGLGAYRQDRYQLGS
jgi:hypothetical protein